MSCRKSPGRWRWVNKMPIPRRWPDGGSTEGSRSQQPLRATTKSISSNGRTVITPAGGMKASSRDPLVHYGPSCPPSEPPVAHTVCPAHFVTDGGVARKRKDAMMCGGVRLSSPTQPCVTHRGFWGVQTARGINLPYLDRVVRRWRGRRRGMSRAAGLLA